MERRRLASAQESQWRPSPRPVEGSHPAASRRGSFRDPQRRLPPPQRQTPRRLAPPQNFPSKNQLTRQPPCRALEISYFPLAKRVPIPSLPVPCQESEEKQKHGKPLPSVSKSLGQGKFCVGNKGLATCCKARTANASVVLAKLLSSPMLTLETSERIFLFPGNLEIAATNNSPVRLSDGLYIA